MQKHVKVYYKHFNLGIDDRIMCEYGCGREAVEIHHIIPRSKFGSTRKDEQDDIKNLIALCRLCHNRAHNEEISKEQLQLAHNYKLCGRPIGKQF